MTPVLQWLRDTGVIVKKSDTSVTVKKSDYCDGGGETLV